MEALNFCWLIDDWKPSREKYLQAWSEKGWPCILWHRGQIRHSPVAGVELRDARELIEGSRIEEVFAYEAKHLNHASCADLFRYEVLLRHGGVYSDIDIFPDVNGEPSLLGNQGVPLFCAVFENMWRRPEIRFIVSSPGHMTLIERMRDKAVYNTLVFMQSGGYAKHGLDNIVHRTGPKMAEAEIYDYARELKVSSHSFLIYNAVQDITAENVREHWTAKAPDIQRIAGLT